MINIRILYFGVLSLAACLVGSCTSDVPDIEPAGQGKELKFAVAGLTRGSVTTDISTAGAKFAVYGDMKLTGAADASEIVVFDNTEVLYTGSQWIYSGTQYWMPKHEHSFVAIHPVNAVDPANFPSYSNSSLTFTFEVPSSPTDEVNKADFKDILAATHRRYYSEGDAALPVSFSFSHLMSLIDILPCFNDNVLDETAFIQFRKVVITGLNNKATFSVKPAPRSAGTQTDDRMIEVTRQEGITRLTITFPDPKKIMNNAANISIFDADDAIIMIPQTFAVDAEAEILLTYTINDDPKEITASIPLNQTEWQPGKSHNYKCSLDRYGMFFNSSSITDWNPIMGTGDATSIGDDDE